MSGKWRVLALMTSAQAGASVLQQSVGVLAPFLIAQFALSKAALGAMFTAMFVGSTATTAMSGVLTDRIGERRMVLLAGSIMALALLAIAAVPQYPWLVAWMAVFGGGYAASTPAGGRAILAWFDRDRGFAMGIRQTGVPVGGFVGALVLPFVALHFGGYRAAFAVAAALVALPALGVVAFYRESGADRGSPESPRAVLAGMRGLAGDRRLIAVTITCMLLVNVQVAMNSFLTVTAVNVVGVAPHVAAIAFAAAFGAATVARLFWGWFSDRYLRDRVLLLGALCVVASLATLAIASLRPSSAVWLVPASLAFGFFGAGWNGVMAAALAEIGGRARAASALGLTLTAVFGASAVGPLLFGTIADRFTLTAAWIFTAGLTLLGTLPPLWARRSGQARNWGPMT